MALIVLLLVSGAAGIAAWLAARAVLQRGWGSAPTAAVAMEIEEHDPGLLRRFVRSRTDAEVVTGLALTLAFAAIIAGGIVVAVLAALVHHSEPLRQLDASAANGAHHNVGPVSRRILEGISWLASTQGVIVVGVVAGVIEWIRVPSRWIPVFLVAVTIGDSLVTNTVKAIVDRARPTIEPAAAALGPSFPSGHSSTAAAFFAALALITGRQRQSGIRALLAGVAVGLAVAVACSRVLLDLHWLSDVVAGLFLGWAWFAACAIAFGGWLMRFGEPAEAAARAKTARSAYESSAGKHEGPEGRGRASSSSGVG